MVGDCRLKMPWLVVRRWGADVVAPSSGFAQDSAAHGTRPAASRASARFPAFDVGHV
jgi:hypothetical protein